MEDGQLNRAFWEGKVVLITGHTGFKGSWLSLWLNKLGADVHGFALPPATEPNLFEQLALKNRIGTHLGDIRDPSRVQEAIKETAPTVVFHLAAQSLVRRSYEDPDETYSTNVLGTSRVLDAAINQDSVRTIIVATSDKCYANDGRDRAFRETDPLGGHDHYSSSKACAELVTHAYRRCGGESPPSIATVRAGNVIGGGDWAEDRLIPDLIRGWGGQPTLIRNPTATRPWQHVLDCLGGYLVLTERVWEHPEMDESWNFGPVDTEVMPVHEVADYVAKSTSGEIQWTTDHGSNPAEAPSLRLDASKARHQLGWSPRLTVRDALDWTIEWYRAVREGKDAHSVTVAQLDAYMMRSDD